MFAAFVFSSLFLVTYITNHAQWSLSRAPASGPIHFPDLALRLGQWHSRLRHARGLSMRQPTPMIHLRVIVPVPSTWSDELCLT